MANITITSNTNASGGYYIILDFGDYYPTYIQEPYHIFQAVAGICGRKILDEVGLELHIEHKEESIPITQESGKVYFYTVDSVNGVAPSDNADLKAKLIELFR